MKTNRGKGYYKVCHPYSMNEETIGYWDGEWWRFYNDNKIESDDGGMFDDDELQWINETKLPPSEKEEPKEQEMSDEDVMLYFAKHCKQSKDMKINYQVFTRGMVLEFAKWYREEMKGK